MLLLRALVLDVRARPLLAALAVGLSVAYALTAGASVAGLRGAEEVLGEGLRVTTNVELHDDAVAVPAGATGWALATTADGQPLAAPRGRATGPDAEAWAGPLVLVPPDTNLTIAGTDLPVRPTARETWPPGVGLDRTIVPADAFDAAFPQLRAKAHVLVGAGSAPAPGARPFYEQGSTEIADSLWLVALASAAVSSLVTAAAVALEIRARRPEWTVLEAIGGRGKIRALVLGRTLAIAGTGAALGLASALGLVFVANRATGETVLRLPLLFTVVATAAVLGLATIAGTAAGLATLREPVAARLERGGIPVLRFRGPVRFLLVTPRLGAALALATAVTLLTLSIVLSTAQLPAEMLGKSEPLAPQAQPGAEAEVVLAAGMNNPLRGEVPRWAAEHPLHPNVTAASPEIYAPTTILGSAVVVRGVNATLWADYTGSSLRQGRWPAGSDEATAGATLARRLGIDPGDRLVVPAAYRIGVRSFTVVGIHNAAGLERDELLVPLDAAADLANLTHNSVHIVRARINDNSALPYLTVPGVAVLRLDTTELHRGAPATALVTVVNTGPVPSSRTLTLQVDGQPTASAVARVEPFSMATVRIPFRAPLRPAILAVNPELPIDPGPARILLEVPRLAYAEEGVPVRVLDDTGRPVPNARVDIGNASARTGDDGRATVVDVAPGRHTVTATAAAGTAAAELRVTRREWADEGHPVLVSAVAADAGPVNETHGRAQVTVTLSNVGGAAWSGTLRIGSANVTASVGPLAEGTAAQQLELPLGDRTIRVALANTTLDARVFLAPPPAAPTAAPVPSLESVIEAKRARALDPGAQDPVEQFTADLFKALDTAVSVIVVATLLHGAAAVVAAVRREISERAPVARLLLSLGASEGQLRNRAIRDTIIAAAPSIAIGIALAYAAIAALSLLGQPRAFGHTLAAAPGWGLAAETALLLGTVAIASAARGLTPQPKRSRAPADLPLQQIVKGGTG